MGCSLTTALGLVNKEANIKIGQSVLIFGSGSVGLSLVEACNMISAHPITVIDIKSKKLDFAKRIGASHTINYNSLDLEEKIKKIFGSSGPEIIIDTVGNPKIINKSYSILSKKGKLVLVGQPKHNKIVIILKMRQVIFMEKSF